VLGPMSDEKPFRFRKSDGELKSTSEGDSRWDDVMAAIYTGVEVARTRLPSAIGRVRVLIVTFAGQTETFRGPANHSSYKPARGIERLPVVLRQIGTTGKLPVHADPKSVV